LKVRRKCRTVAMHGGKPRALLAVLSLHANEPVNAESAWPGSRGCRARAAPALPVQAGRERLAPRASDDRNGRRALVQLPPPTLLLRPGEAGVDDAGPAHAVVVPGSRLAAVDGDDCNQARAVTPSPRGDGRRPSPRRTIAAASRARSGLVPFGARWHVLVRSCRARPPDPRGLPPRTRPE
jgi:hypothetical protein